MVYGHSHRPVWPPYRPGSKILERTLAVWDERMIVTEHGECFDICNVTDFCNAVFDNNLYLVSDTIDAFPYVNDIVLSGHHDVFCTERGKPSLMMLKHGRERRFMVKTSLWNREAHADVSLLKALRRLFEYVGLGVKPTPKSLGTETMRVTWSKNNLQWYRTPSIPLEMYIKNTCSGCIVQTPGLNKDIVHDSTILLDRKSAFPAEMAGMPIGTAVSTDYLDKYPIWYGKCRVVVNDTLPLGPFPVRDDNAPGANSIVKYHQTFGEYDTYLWSFQVPDCEKVGVHVYPQDGWAWEKTTDDACIWTQEMYDFRQRSEDAEVAGYVKIITNAAIGGLGTNRSGYVLVPKELATEGDDVVVLNGEPVFLFIQKRSRPHESIMTHWWHCNIARNNSAVFNFALPYAERNRLLWINYDAIMITDGPEKYIYPEKRVNAPMGTWTSEVLHDVTIPAARTYTSRERAVTPGVTRPLDTV